MSEPSADCPHPVDGVTLTTTGPGMEAITVYCPACTGKWTEDEIPMGLLLAIVDVTARAADPDVSG